VSVRVFLTLCQPATYQIRVPGELGENWSNWAGGMTITVESADDGPPVTTLIGTVDQAVFYILLCLSCLSPEFELLTKELDSLQKILKIWRIIAMASISTRGSRIWSRKSALAISMIA
jgi:hypothetical protein